MKINLTSTIIAAMGLMVASCVVNRGVVPSKDMTSYEVKVDNITAISTQTSIAVVYTQAPETSVKVDCPENLADYVVVRERDGVLSVGFKSGTSISGFCNVTVSVTSPELNRVEASSSSKVALCGALKQSSPLSVAISSSASFEAQNLTVSKLEVEASSSAEASLDKVNAVEIDFDASSSADIVATAVLCGTVKADASSAAKIEISGSADNGSYEASSAATIDAGALNVGKLIKAKATSAANIDYRAESVGSVCAGSAGSVNRKK